MNTPLYPIDGADGPQQTLRRLVNPAALGTELSAKIACSVVLRVLQYHKAGYFTDPNGDEGMSSPLRNDCFYCRRNSLMITKLHLELQESLPDAKRIMQQCLGAV